MIGKPLKQGPFFEAKLSRGGAGELSVKWNYSMTSVQKRQ